ncbi:MAG: hypothetical protein ACRC6V_07745 [Bacteroidales bacterium]
MLVFNFTYVIGSANITRLAVVKARTFSQAVKILKDRIPDAKEIKI